MNHKLIENNKKVFVTSPTSIHLKKILIAVCIALMAVIASVSGLNVAQPMLAIEFDVSQNTVLWIINIYTLTLAALLLPLGAMGDRLGRKKMLLLGLLIFCAASAMSAFAINTATILISRLLTGVGAALIMPVTLAVITSTFPKEKRSKAIGIWTGVAGGGGILGMYLSALLVDVASWRWLFLLPVVFGVVSIILTVRYVPDSVEKSEHRFDIIGSILSVIATVSIIYGLHEAPGHGWFSPVVFSSLTIGIIGVIGFIIWELRYMGAILDTRLFRKPGLSGGSITLLIVFGVQAGIFIVLFPFFQSVLGWSALRSTLGMMPMALLMMLSSGLAPKLAIKVGNRYTMAIGIALGATGALLLGQMVSVDGGYVSVLPGTIVMGLGMGFSMTPSTEAITSSLPADQQGVASALNDITRELGTALGIALLGPLVTAGYSAAIGDQLNELPQELITTAKQGLAHAQAVAPGTGRNAEMVIRVARDAFVSGWQQAMWIGAGIMAVLFIYILIKGPQKQGRK